MMPRFIAVLLVFATGNLFASDYSYTQQRGNTKYVFVINYQNLTVTFDSVAFFDANNFIPVTIYNATDTRNTDWSDQSADITTDIKINSISIDGGPIIGTRKFTSAFDIPAIGRRADIRFNPATTGAPSSMTIHGDWTVTGPTESFSDEFSSTLQLNAVSWFTGVTLVGFEDSGKLTGEPELRYSLNDSHAPDTAVVDGVTVAFPPGDIQLVFYGDGGYSAVLLSP